MFDIHELFDDFDNNIICVEDLDIVVDGALITHITRDSDNVVRIWAGHPDDKFTEELTPSKETRKQIFEHILEEME